MGVTTYDGRIRRALLHKANSTYWVGIGRTTAWDDEENPPDPSPGVHEIEEPICYVKAETVSLVKPVDPGLGNFTHLDQEYAYVDDADAYTESARWLYVKAEFHPSQGQPYGNFRQVGVFTELVPVAGYEEDLWLAPANVDDPGKLEYLDNDVVTVMAPTRYEVIPIIIEFR